MVPAVMTFAKPAAAFRWAKGPALAFTLSGLFLRHVTLPANPTIMGPAGGIWGEFLGHLGDLVQIERPPVGKLQKDTLSATHTLGSSSPLLTQALQKIKQDESFPDWLAWHTQHEWSEHTTRLGGFFDREFIDEVSAATGMSAAEAISLWQRLSDPVAVVQLGSRVRSGLGGEEAEAAIDSWLVSTILRGVYHDELARRRNRQSFRHPIRAFILQDTLRQAQRQTYPANPAQRYFAGIVLGLSYTHKGVTARSALYAENLIRCRSAIASQQLQLADDQAEMTASVGLDRAVREAQHLIKKNVLEVNHRDLSLAVDISIGVATSVGGFSLAPWVGLVAGVGAAVAQTVSEPGPRVARARIASSRRLQDLAQATAGPVDIIH